MTDWQTAMLLILPILLVADWAGEGIGAWWRAAEPKLRCWAAIFLGSLAARAVTPEYGSMPFQAFICIDLLAGIACAVRPFGLPQRAILLLYIPMVLLSVVYGWLGWRADDFFGSASQILGFAMWLILLLWGMRDAGRGVAAFCFGGARRDRLVAARLAAVRRDGAEP